MPYGMWSYSERKKQGLCATCTKKALGASARCLTHRLIHRKHECERRTRQRLGLPSPTTTILPTMGTPAWYRLSASKRLEWSTLRGHRFTGKG